MAFLIEKGIPRKQPGRPTLYPFAEMEVGDSFYVPCDDISYDTVSAARTQVQCRARQRWCPHMEGSVMGVIEEYELHQDDMRRLRDELAREPEQGFDSRGWDDDTAKACPNCDCGLGVHVESRPISGPMLTCTKCKRTCA